METHASDETMFNGHGSEGERIEGYDGWQALNADDYHAREWKCYIPYIKYVYFCDLFHFSSKQNRISNANHGQCSQITEL